MKDNSDYPHSFRGQEVIDVPALFFLPPAMARDARVEISHGGSGVEVMAAGKEADAESAHADTDGGRNEYVKLIGAAGGLAHPVTPSAAVWP